MQNRKIITATILLLSFVSFFTDIASEMLYPIMPLYLNSIGFSIIFIGVLEGVAEAIAGLSKGYFGKLSDNIGRRLPFVQIGYLLSALSKPMIIFFSGIWWIFLMRSTDRIGKGIRTGARDAMLSDQSTPETKARVFGFHRSMDTLGAVIGPLIALIYLYYYPENYSHLFLIAFIPGVLAIIFTLLLREEKKEVKEKKRLIPFFSFVKYLQTGSLAYRKLAIALLVFTLFNSSDVFLLLKLKESGLGDSDVLIFYIFYNLIYALASYPLGVIADKLGFKIVLTSGLFIFSMVYLSMALNENYFIFWIIFFAYGLYAASTEGVAKAWISNIADKKDTATAIGTYTAFQSIFTKLASSLAGLIWYYAQPEAVFLVSAIAVFLVVIYCWIFVKDGV